MVCEPYLITIREAIEIPIWVSVFFLQNDLFLNEPASFIIEIFAMVSLFMPQPLFQTKELGHLLTSYIRHTTKVPQTSTMVTCWLPLFITVSCLCDGMKCTGINATLRKKTHCAYTSLLYINMT